VKRRPLLSWLAALILAGAAGAQEPKASASPGGPRIAVEPASFDFGQALPGKTLHKEFVIRNHGNEDLAIEGVSTTCGCTAALADRQKIRPGASTVLRVSLETRSYSGPLQRLVLVRSNDPTRALLEVKLQVTVADGPAPGR
jgi:hypothetical protein